MALPSTFDPKTTAETINSLQKISHITKPQWGKMTGKEWSTQFYKHIDHHFRQFGA